MKDVEYVTRQADFRRTPSRIKEFIRELHLCAVDTGANVRPLAGILFPNTFEQLSVKDAIRRVEMIVVDHRSEARAPVRRKLSVERESASTGRRKDDVSMPRMKVGAARAAASVRRATAVLVAGIVLLLAQPSGRAQSTPAPPLQFFKNYFLPGADYRVGGVGLRGLGQNGFATGNLTVGGIPDDAFIAAAFMYLDHIRIERYYTRWGGGFFPGSTNIRQRDWARCSCAGMLGVRRWSRYASITTQARVYRADILKNFPLSTAEATLGKPVVNGTHQVRVADSGGGGSQSPSSGNQAIRAEGAVVVIVFQTTGAPLKAVVMYDGVYTVNQDSRVFSLNVGAYYDAADTSNAKLTTFVADGRNRPENLSINGNPIADTNPFRSAQGSAWDNPEFPVSGPVLDAGIPVEMTFPSSSIDCLTWAGVVAKVDVPDTDGDGIPDGVEDAATPFVEPPSRGHPNGVVQPDYHAMGGKFDGSRCFRGIRLLHERRLGGNEQLSGHTTIGQTRARSTWSPERSSALA